MLVPRKSEGLRNKVSARKEGAQPAQEEPKQRFSRQADQGALEAKLEKLKKIIPGVDFLAPGTTIR
jgi:hypothetical protein